MKSRRLLPRLALLLLLIAAVGWAALHRDRIDLATLDASLGSLGAWMPIGYVALYAVATVAFVPGAAFALAGGALLGPFWGSILNLVGATLGATLAFLVARYVAGDWVGRRAGGLLKRLIDGVDAEGWRFVAFVRLVPLFPFNLSNYALGLTHIPLHQYVLATLVCMVPATVAYTWLGYAGRGALAGDTDAVWYGLLALGLLAAKALPSSMSEDAMNSSARSGTSRPRAIFPWPNSKAGYQSLPGLNAGRSSSFAARTSARRRRRGPCVPPALRRSTCCAAGWRNGTRPACRCKPRPHSLQPRRARPRAWLSNHATHLSRLQREYSSRSAGGRRNAPVSCGPLRQSIQRALGGGRGKSGPRHLARPSRRVARLPR